MILIQSYQEFYYALKVLQLLKECDITLYEKLQELITAQINKLV